MSDLTAHWRPAPTIKTKALALTRRGDDLLLCAILDDTGAIKGWRPLGGTVEFGERAEVTVARELSEEISATCRVGALLGVLENIYTHHGETGHEIVLVCDVALLDVGLAARDSFVMVEDNGARCHVEWVPMAEFTSGRAQLFPTGLLDLL